MKTKIKLIIFAILLVSALFINNKVQALLPLSGKTIIIDPGHGGKDPGTTFNTVYEKDINLAISKYLEIELTKLGATVKLTRDGDYDLSSPKAYWRKKSDFDNRIKLINESKGNLYLSIHLNYLSNTTYSGPQVFYDSDKEKTIANIIQEKLNEATKQKRHTKIIPQKTYMYSKLNVPGVLIECGFLSNSNERNSLKTSEYQQFIAKTIAEAIASYY